MRHSLKLLSLLGLCLCLVSGCKKLIDVIIRDPGNSIAAFNLVTSSQDCPNVITKGNFRTGINLLLIMVLLAIGLMRREVQPSEGRG